VCKKLIKNFQLFGKNVRKTGGGGLFLTHTVCDVLNMLCSADSHLLWYGVAMGALVGIILVVIDEAVAKQPLLQVVPPLLL